MIYLVTFSPEHLHRKLLFYDKEHLKAAALCVAHVHPYNHNISFHNTANYYYRCLHLILFPHHISERLCNPFAGEIGFHLALHLQHNTLLCICPKQDIFTHLMDERKALLVNNRFLSFTVTFKQNYFILWRS